MYFFLQSAGLGSSKFKLNIVYTVISSVTTNRNMYLYHTLCIAIRILSKVDRYTLDKHTFILFSFFQESTGNKTISSVQ